MEQTMRRRKFAKAELDSDPKHAVSEMDHSGIDMHVGIQASLNGEAKYPPSRIELVGDRMTAEVDGREQLASEPSSYKRFSWPFHEKYDPPARPGELPATVPLELPASPLATASRRSNSSSPVFRSGNMSPVDGSNGSSPMRQPSRG